VVEGHGDGVKKKPITVVYQGHETSGVEYRNPEKWKKARKKPIVVEFREVDGDKEGIPTREGYLYAYKGKDLIIKGIKGEIYPIGKEIFEATYEVIETP